MKGDGCLFHNFLSKCEQREAKGKKLTEVL